MMMYKSHQAKQQNNETIKMKNKTKHFQQFYMIKLFSFFLPF